MAFERKTVRTPEDSSPASGVSTTLAGSKASGQKTLTAPVRDVSLRRFRPELILCSQRFSGSGIDFAAVRDVHAVAQATCTATTELLRVVYLD
ncbi:MAG: hypothetical protein ACT4OM_05485 [Actinomycetota bacterium]